MILCESDVCMNSYKDVDTVLLVDMARADDDAFFELVVRYTPMMNKVINGFVCSALRYDEAFAEACIALHRAVMTYDVTRANDITFGLYSRICVYRRILDLISKLNRESAIAEVDVELISSESNIEQRLMGRERMEKTLSLARRVLSKYEYDVFVLYIEGYSTTEMAERLSKDVKSVDNAKGRMFRRLRELHGLFDGF